MSIKKNSESIRNKLLGYNLKRLPELDSNPNLAYLLSSSIDRGSEANLHFYPVKDAGSIDDSASHRDRLLGLNLGTPKDIQKGIVSLFGGNTYANWLYDRGTETNINWLKVANRDAGSIDEDSPKYFQELFRRNKSTKPTEAEENTINRPDYDYNSLIQTIGEPVAMHDYSVTRKAGITKSLDLAEQFLALNKNKYKPIEINLYENVIVELEEKLNNPYIVENTNKFLNAIQPESYTPDFLYGLTKRTTIPKILLQGDRLLENDTVLMNIAARQVKYDIETRIKQNLINETAGRVNLVNALTNPITAINLFREPLKNIVDRKYHITDGPNILSKSARFLLGLAGVEIPVSFIPLDLKPLTPTCFSGPEGQKYIETINQTRSRNRKVINDGYTDTNRNEILLDYTGNGQKSVLFDTLKYNKYTPDYNKIFEGKFRKIGETLANATEFTKYLGIGAGRAPSSQYYLGSKTYQEPISIMMDSDGDIVRGPESLIKAWTNTTVRRLDEDIIEYTEPGLGSYKSITGELIWLSGGEREVSDPDKPISTLARSKFSTNESLYFKECGILDKTRKLVEKGAAGGAISQVATRFENGDYVYSKGNATRKVVQNEYNKQQGRKTYDVTNEYCRTWTKVKPYSKITDAVRYKELIRKERSSVLDRFGNYNIFPTPLNVNAGFGNSETQVEYFGEKRARKYMFSIENLAWKDSDKANTLPPCEKGANGGRVMWFPPYDINFTDNTSANWTTHNLLGRPEPIYTYNNTERTGTLSWKIIVDHPSIFNLITKRELANLPDEKFDAIIDAFWAGCVEYDIYELARIWGVFSNDEIETFKNLIEGIKKTNPNDNVRRVKEVVELNGLPETPVLFKTPEVSATLKEEIKRLKVFFANDVPLMSDDGKEKPFDTYFTDYQNIITSTERQELRSAYNETLQDIFSGSIDNNNSSYGYLAQYNELKRNLKKLSETSTNRSLTIQVGAATSAVGSDEYNSKLAIRRIVSFGLWIAKEMNGYTEKGQSLSNFSDTELYDEIVRRNNGKVSIVFYKQGLAGKFDEVKIVPHPTNNLKELTVSEMLADFGSLPYLMSIDGKTIECTEENFTDNTTANGLMCSVLSEPAASARFVKIREIFDRETEAFEPDETSTPIPTYVVREIGDAQPTSEAGTDVTKRDIAQRILNKVITECDYFEYLNETTPVIYQSLKEKIKYFTPSFHSMTPEGLNSRLTFLQQCLRPGETIRSKDGKGCDADNTAFGKPPVCILRIGDFYHTKIIIDTINISYEPLVWDLNPEGIGVQPMIANVNMNFKMIGGQGLRKPVEQLQNALSFNFYGNADIYDDRTFANTDAKERALNNLEQNFFNNNQLDLVDVVQSADFELGSLPNNVSEGTIGQVVNVNAPEVVPTTGKTAFADEYSVGQLYETFDFSYRRAYDNLYNDYKTLMTRYLDFQKEVVKSTETAPTDILLGTQVFLNKQDIEYASEVDNPTLGIVDNNTRLVRLSQYRYYHQVGVDLNSELNRVTNNSYKNFVPYLHLYPQQDLFKLSSGPSGLTYPTNAIQTNDFKNIFIPNISNLDIINTNLTKLTDNFREKIKQGLIVTLTKDFNQSGVVTKWNQLLTPYQRVFKRVLLNEFEKYLTEITTQYDSQIVEMTNYFDSVLFNLQGVSTIANGVDGTIKDDGRPEYYEVIPNGKVIDEDVISNFFGHDPYQEIRLLTIHPDNTLYSDANQTQNKVIANIDATISSQVVDNLVLGSYSYLDDQIDSGSSFASNNLPLYDQGTQTWSINNGQILDSELGVKSTISSDFKMTHTFEKLSYELYEFGNKTTEILLNDTTPPANRKFTSAHKFETVELNKSGVSLENLLEADAYDHDVSQVRLLLFDSAKEIKSVKFNFKTTNQYATMFDYINKLFVGSFTVTQDRYNQASTKYNYSYVDPTLSGNTASIQSAITANQTTLGQKEAELINKEAELIELLSQNPQSSLISDLESDIETLQNEILTLNVEINEQQQLLESIKNQEYNKTSVLPTSIVGTSMNYNCVDEAILLSFYSRLINSDDFKNELVEAFDTIKVTRTEIKNNPNKKRKIVELSSEFIDIYLRNVSALVNDINLNNYLLNFKSDIVSSINSLSNTNDGLDMVVGGEDEYILKLRKTDSLDNALNNKIINYSKMLKFSITNKRNLNDT